MDTRGKEIPSTKSSPDEGWNIHLVHEDAEYHHLSRDDLLAILEDEWEKEFNALLIGRDVDCLGRLGAFFLGDAASVYYEEFDTGRWLSSYGPNGGDELVRLSPENAEDYCFLRCQLIDKAGAWYIVQSYVASLQVVGLR
jgi:hypothetical protein